MFNLEELIYFQIVGVILSLLSFTVFISALKSAPETIKEYNEDEWFSEDNDDFNAVHKNYNDEMYYKDTKMLSDEQEAVIEFEPIDGEEFEEDFVVQRKKPNIFNTMFKRVFSKPLKTSNKDVDDEEINKFDEKNSEYNLDFKDSSLENVQFLEETDDFDNDSVLDDFEENHSLETIVDDNIDDEVFEDFPHEQRGITIFSKEVISDDEIGDLKELISTIKKEFNSQNNNTTIEPYFSEEVNKENS